MKYLYHLTKPEYLDRILSEGLKPIVKMLWKLNT